MKFILMDVEGTTTSISFVHDTLFPFSIERLKSFVAKNADKKEVQNILEQVKEQKTISNDEACDILLGWIKADLKHPALKNLQGLIWEEGYVSGEIKGHIYDDVLPALEKWKENRLSLAVYSSGSVKAQHLIFQYSTAGNLRGFFSNHFDTAVGNKREKESYMNISKQLKVAPEQILFLSDIKEELDAAKEAGMLTTQLVRQSDVIVGSHPSVKSFTEIKI